VRRLEGLGDALSKVSNARAVESVDCRTASLLGLQQTLDGGNYDAAEPEMLRPGKDVICGAPGQRGIGDLGNRDEVDQASPTSRIRPPPEDFLLAKLLIRKGPGIEKAPDLAVVQT